MASERSLSVTISDSRVVSQYSSCVTMLNGAGPLAQHARLNALDTALC